MSNKIHVVHQTEADRVRPLGFTKRGKHSARKLTWAHILLLADEGQTDKHIAQTLHRSTATVHRVRKRFVNGNLDGALNKRPRLGGIKKLAGKDEAPLETFAQSAPSSEHEHRTLQLLADRLMALQVVDSTSYETVSHVLRSMRVKLSMRSTALCP